MARRVAVDIQPQARKYGSECDMELYFHQLSQSSYFLVLELFSRNRTNDRSFLSIPGYGA